MRQVWKCNSPFQLYLLHDPNQWNLYYYWSSTIVHVYCDEHQNQQKILHIGQILQKLVFELEISINKAQFLFQETENHGDFGYKL